jgi:hypothetical protein
MWRLEVQKANQVKSIAFRGFRPVVKRQVLHYHSRPFF